MSTRTESVLMVFEKALETGLLVIDVESNHASVHQVDWEFWGVGIRSGTNAVYVPVEDPIIQSVVDMIWGFDGDVVMHNSCFDLSALKKALDLKGFPLHIVDTMIGLNLLDENLSSRELGLKPTALRLFKRKRETYEESVKYGRYSYEFECYCCDDTLDTFDLWNWERPQLEEQKLMSLFRKIYCEVVKVVTDMKMIGFRWDLEVAQDLMNSFKVQADKAEIAARLVLGDQINLNSADQLANVMFKPKSDGGLGLPTSSLPWTKGGVKKEARPKVDEGTFEALAHLNPVMRSLRDWKFATGQMGKYIWKITELAMADPESRTHPDIWLVSTTGRTRMQNPPNQTITKYPPITFQNVAKGKVTFAPEFEIRRGFKAREGYTLVTADFAAFQLRLNAHIARDQAMIDAFCSWQCRCCNSSGSDTVLLSKCPKCGVEANEKTIKDPTFKGFWHGADLHTETYNHVNKVLGRQVLKSRHDGKTANFSLIFGASAWKMNLEFPQYSKDEWEGIIKAFFIKYHGTKEYHHRMDRLLMETGETNDIFGRKRRISQAEIASSKKHALNQFLNFPVQCCLGEGTPLLTKDGYKPIELVTKDVYDGIGFDSPFEIVDAGKKPCFCLTTSNKKSVTASKEHRFPVFEDGKLLWKALKFLSNNDYVVSMEAMAPNGSLPSFEYIDFTRKNSVANQIEVPKDVMESDAYLVGVLIGDGSYRDGYSIRVAVGKDDINDYGEFLFDLLTLRTGMIPNVNVGINEFGHCFSIDLNSVKVRSKFKMLGLEELPCKSKKVPVWLLNAPVSYRIAVLQGLFDTDGGKTSSGVQRYVSFTSTSKFVIEQVGLLLGSLGIDFSFRLSLLGDKERIHLKGAGLERFRSVVGFRCPRKAKYLDDLVVPNETCDLSPALVKFVASLINEERKKVKWGSRSLSAKERSGLNRMTRLGAGSRKTILDYAKKSGLVIPEETLYALNLTWKKIESIVPVGIKRTFDLGFLGKNHTYIANGLWTHNSEVHYAELAMVRFREWLIKEDLYSDGRVQSGKVALVMFNHDEIVAEAPKKIAPYVGENLVKIMRYLVPLKVPIDAELKIQECWS